MTGGDAVVGVLGAVLMALALFGSLYPVPDYPFNLLPYGFLAYMAVGAAWFLVLKARQPAVLLAMNSDLEVAAADDFGRPPEAQAPTAMDYPVRR